MSNGARAWLAMGVTVLTGMVLVIPLSMAAIAFLRDRMHLYCSFLAMGDDDPGAYYCADGIGYLVPGLVLGFFTGLILFAAALILLMFLERRLLAGIGIAGTAFVVVASLVAGAPRPGDGQPPAGAWADVMAGPSALLAAASALLVVSMFLPVSGARIALGGALAVLVITTVFEPTLVFGTVPAALAVGAALVLASLRAPAASAAVR
ncbi:hypothetical protein [Mycetocola miduiensis]|uniref:Uncharacterized protein n=1 Tax=Mycetocola miduiensis TaxID=995034 RepID=A0A1I4YUH5_9MICO|nr:hypothetical protein [Mycetocola miduiensis]SFN41652.1 hypothetical protein SAMN05216219_0528 [Mycetocola miduiensis]